MADWITRHRYRFLIVIGSYFCFQVILRAVLSSSLDYDESEQVFLSQWTLWGYNSQPPLYTWMQKVVFKLFGYNPFSLALLKNVLLFLTYVSVYALVHKETGDPRQAVVASLGMLMIPQISWESHRDLSHTVAVTFATAALVYCVIALEKDKRTFWYIAIGLVCAFGILSKYNFAIIILAVVAAVLTIPAFRRNLLDYRIGWSFAIAAILVAPHVYWMIEHRSLVSQKTIATLSGESTHSYLQNVSVGLKALFVSAFASCCLLCLSLFAIAYRSSLWEKVIQARENYRQPVQVIQTRTAASDTTILIGRIFLVVTAILVLFVLSGNVLEFKNRWIQPFVCLLPAYLVLRFRDSGFVDRVAMNRVVLTGFLLMATILIGIAVRPTASPRWGKYSLLNIPFRAFCETIRQQEGADPPIILAANMRIAGNLKRHFPESLVLSASSNYILGLESVSKRIRRDGQHAIVVTDTSSPLSQQTLQWLTTKLVALDHIQFNWESIQHPYYYDVTDKMAMLEYAHLAESSYEVAGFGVGEIPVVPSSSDRPKDGDVPHLSNRPVPSDSTLK
ncbi:Undecaprenyl phosphate-alpha-4-amino-4-deoxy-L-arabinose arabinosyl transferase [Novipirellula aureliae]|uniref:Undecaprenyl phosphate-alpha-4-amino-4-deoxy-L-arabinose arabinosyl transferase n=1 Tax=Novipirellula aureliae TaxID=2527966 RepID=A0A5C6E6Y2_9BACT|nr:glycosyltransferase family 39 protein [Novipirellula aureliae]TWU43226.1 Undecaprenyl phosphate-alpha-4-amino-4-deoxy-L-arabinose arabinosyl transferase [Novipirellula aureliae]